MTKDADWVIGRQFGHLKVLERLPDHKSSSSNLKAQVLCFCTACGRRIAVTRYYLLRKPNPKTHCGCLGGPQRAHDERPTIEYKPEYTSWKMMQERCLNKFHPGYADYGGRGITIDPRWLDVKSGFRNFLEDVGLKPTRDHTLDRINPNENYTKLNVRWATPKEQARNKRKDHEP